MATGALSQAGVMASRAWSWWWEGSNRRDELDREAFTLLLITAAALTCFLTWRKKKTNRCLPPGPMGLPLLVSLPFWATELLHRRFAVLARTYGPVMSLRLGTRLYVVVSSPAAAKEVFRDHEVSFANRDVPAATAVLSYGGRDVGWNTDPASWRFLRKMCVRELLNSSSLDALYALRRGEVRAAVREVYGRRGTPVGVGELSFLTFLDVMTNMLWGGNMEGGERSSASGRKKEFREVLQDMMEIAGMPNVSDLVPALALFDLQGVARRMKKLVGWWDGILNRIIDARLRADGGDRRSSSASRDNKDFLDVMLHALKKSGAETPLTVDNVKATFLDMALGGTDTSSATVEWAMAEMIHNREALRRAQEELDAVVGGDVVVEESHLAKLPYLDAVVKETLRLHPVVPLISRRSSEPCVVEGHHIPAGATVLINAWTIHRDPSSWEDASEFKPERFSRGGDTRWDYRGGGGSDFRFLPFGSGRRICAGIAMGERMTMFLLATFLHSFEWRLPAGAEVDFTEAAGFTVKMARPLYAVPTPRLSDPELYE